MSERCALCGFQSDEAYGSLSNHLRYIHEPGDWYPMVVAALKLSEMPGFGLHHTDPRDDALKRSEDLATEWVNEAKTQPAETKVRILRRVAALRKALKVGRRRA